MDQPPDEHPPRPAHGDPARGHQAPRSPLVWLLPVFPLVAALMLASWPTPPAASGATEVFAGAFPTADELALQTAARSDWSIGPSDELAQAADLLVLSFELAAPPSAAPADADSTTGPAPSEAAQPEVPRSAGPPPQATVTPPPQATAAPRPSPTSTPTPRPTATPAPAAPTEVAPVPVAPTATPTSAPVATIEATPLPTPVPTASPAPTAVLTAAAGPPPANTTLTPREGLLLAAMNEARAAVGLGALTPRDDLTDVARARSEEMIRLDYFAHFHPDGHSAYQFLAEAGITFSAAGENLVKTFGDVQHSVEIGFQALWDSPTHRDNILKSTYTKVGVGSHTDDDGTTIITTIFTDR